jgi:hypothetical protein
MGGNKLDRSIEKMDRAVANGIALESPHDLDLFRVEQKFLRLDISYEGVMYFWAVKMSCEESVVGPKILKSQE